MPVFTSNENGNGFGETFAEKRHVNREKVGFRSKAERLVEKRRTQAREGIKMPESFRAKPVTFAKLAERGLAYSKANKRSYSHDKLRMKLLTDDFGNRIAEDITRADIRLWLDSKSEEWPATSNRYLALLKLTYRLAEDDGLIKSNPTRGIKQSKENGRVRYLSDAEEERLRAVIQKSFPERLAEFEVGLMTGMRQGEQFTREWSDIDLGAGTIRLPLTKNGECRIVQLNTRALASLRMLHAQSIGSGHVFSNLVPRWFTEAVERAKVEDFKWHDLRHTFASRLVISARRRN